MLSLDLFNSRYEKKLHEGALDNTITRTQAHLMEPLSQRAADIRTQIRNGKLSGAELDKLEKEYEDLVQKRLDIMLDRQPKNEQQVPSKQDPFAYVKPEPRGIGDIQDPKQKMAQLAQQSKKGPLANVGAGLKAFIKGEPEPMGEEQAINPRALGVANFQRLLKANMGNIPTASLEFIRPEENFKLDQKGLELISDYYDGLENDQAKNYFIYRVLPSGDETLKILKQLGWTPHQEPKQQSLPGIPTQGELPLQEKKKFNDDDLEAGDVKVARELQKLRAQYPAAKSDIEAVARAEIDSTERSQQQLAAIRGANEKQDALLKQLVDLDQEQGREIGNLDKENNSLEQRLAQVQATNDRLQQAVGTMTGNKKAAAKTQKLAPQGSADLAQGGIIDVGAPVAPASDTTSTDKSTTSPAMDYTAQQLGGFANQKPLQTLKPAPILKRAAESRIKEHGGGIGPKKHWQSMMPEGQPQELIHRYLAIDAENDVDAVRAAIQAISRDPALSVTSKSRLLGQIGMIIRRHRLPIGRAYYQFMRQYMEDISETALNPKDPKDDYEAKRRALHDLSLNKGVDQQAVLQRRLDLDQEAKAKGLAETVTNVKAGMAEIYRRLAPKIERHRDSFLAGQLYDELENYAELHGAEGEFKRMMSTARNRAHMEYDTNPGGFQNWFWFLPFEDDQLEEGLGDTLKSLWREIKTYVVDFVANAVGLPDDQRREVFVQAGNTFSNEVIKLLANHPARDKLVPMVREIGGYMAKARTLKELNSLMDKADLFLADVDAGKFDPPVAKTLPSFGDRQGMTENTDDVKKRMSKLEALALAANRAGDDAKCKMYQQKIQSLKQKLSQSMSESLKPGEYHIHTVYFKDGTKKRIRVISNEFDVIGYYKQRGQAVDRVDYDYQIHSDMTEDFGLPGATIPRKSVIQGYTVFFNPKTQVVSVTRGGDSEEAAIEQARVGTPSMKNFRQAAVRLIDKIESDLTENLTREPRTARERDDMIDKIRRMMTQDRNPANLQIMKKDIEILQTKYRDLKEDSGSGEAVEMAIMRRMLVAHTDLIVEFGLDKVVAAIEEVAYDVGDVDEIGSSDVSGWVRQVERILGVEA
jgi:hypothetical protein